MRILSTSLALIVLTGAAGAADATKVSPLFHEIAKSGSHKAAQLSFTEGRVMQLTRPLMRGADVAKLQTELKRRGYFRNRVDGVFGGRTYRSLRTIQSDIGLPATGIADERTLRILYKRLPVKQRAKTLEERTNDPSDPIFGR